jgi:CRISPR-associated protein Cas1
MDILILNHRATLSSGDILKLTKNNISILLVSYNNDNFSIINSANTKNGDNKLAQYNALENRLNIAKYYIKQKFISHQEQLKANNINEDFSYYLQQIENTNAINDLMGYEGSFAKDYFKYFFNLIPKNMHKSKRTKRPPQDPVNAVLSYWYSLYYQIITIKLISYGFEPSIGYLHTPFRSHNALSSDILEVFRAAINQAVISLFKNNLLQIEDFSKKGGVYLKYDGRKKIWREFVDLVNILKPQLDNEIANLKKMINEKNNNN